MDLLTTEYLLPSHLFLKWIILACAIKMERLRNFSNTLTTSSAYYPIQYIPSALGQSSIARASFAWHFGPGSLYGLVR